MKVIDYFYSLQGEGSEVGTPAYFIRLAGCPVKCPWCDTKYAWDQKAPEVKDFTAKLMVEFIKNKAPENGIVVITGGEPFIYAKELYEVIRSISEYNEFLVPRKQIQLRIETSASIKPELEDSFRCGNNVRLNISPKAFARKTYAQYWDPQYGFHVNEFRFPIAKEKGQGFDWFEKFMQDHPSLEAPEYREQHKIFLSPVLSDESMEHGITESDMKWAKEVLDYALTFHYRFSLQMHKLLDFK